MEHNREPIGHTCPDIDKVIKSISVVMKLAGEGYKMQEDDLKNAMEEIHNELWGLDKVLEKLRKSNEELRAWGIDEATQFDKLEDKQTTDEELIKNFIAIQISTFL